MSELTMKQLEQDKNKNKCDRCNHEFLEDDDQIETFDDELLCSPCFIKKENEND